MGCKDSRNNTYTCLRTLFDEVEEEDTIFCLFEDDESFVEYYDIKSDPYQLNNLAPIAEGNLSKKRELLSQLKACKGREECSLGVKIQRPISDIHKATKS